MPSQVAVPPLVALEADRVAGPLVIDRPQLVIRQMRRAGLGGFQVRAGPSGGQCMRMTTVITAGVPIRTSDIRCSTAGARPLATRSARPMGVTRIAQLTGRDGSAGRPRGANMAPVQHASPAIAVQQEP